VVYVAAERLFRRQYNVILPTSALEISKQDAEDVLKLKRGLEQVGWYDGVPLDIRAVPERLTRQDADVRIEAIANNLKAFDEPRALAGDRRAPELKDRIRNWLAQFREDGLISAAMEVLEKMRFLDRGDTHDALTAFLDANPEFEGATVCPLGELKDSGAVQAYISRDLERRLPRTGTVEEAVERSWEAPILFLDDFTASGSQALDILGHWFGDGTLQQSQLGEERLPFGEREREFLRSRPIGFVFVAGWDEGMRRVREAVTKLELDAKVYVHIPERDLPFAFSGGSQSKDIGRFKERCVVVGRQLLQSAGKDSEKQADRALGYGNRAMLLGSRLNIPTQTLTCIWMDGRVDGVDWHALLRRREKH
jgi:hypothetical protein